MAQGSGMGSERGQAVVETVAALGLAILAMMAAVGTAALVVAKIYINHCAYEAAVCELGSSSECRQQLRKRLGAIPWVAVQQIEISRDGSWAQSRVRTLVLGQFAWRETVNVALPSSAWSP